MTKMGLSDNYGAYEGILDISVIRAFSTFPLVLELGRASVTLYADGGYVGNVEELETELERVKDIGASGGIKEAILWLVLREMKRG